MKRSETEMLYIVHRIKEKNEMKVCIKATTTIIEKYTPAARIDMKKKIIAAMLEKKLSDIRERT